MSIEEDVKRCKELIKIEHANWIGISNQLAIAHLIEKIKELEEEKKIILNSKIGIDLSYDDYIPKQKVKDKMEKLNKEIKNGDEVDAIFKIKQQQILQELLEDK